MGKTKDSDSVSPDWHELIKRDVTRKQFLMILSGGLVAILGFGNFISFFESATKHKKQITKTVSTTSTGNGFGSRKFGE
jgi:hypothetical protein